MQQHFNLAWKGHFYGSKEHCSISISDREILINGQIRSRPTDIDLRLAYAIRLTPEWETLAVRVAGSFEARPVDYDFHREGTVWKNWDGTSLTGGLEPDISLSPLTNTLPIRRLKPAIGASAEIEVLYLDIAGGSIGIRRQRYTRLSENDYRFETVPPGFEAVILTDDAGFVTEYPELFSRM